MKNSVKETLLEAGRYTTYVYESWKNNSYLTYLLIFHCSPDPQFKQINRENDKLQPSTYIGMQFIMYCTHNDREKILPVSSTQIGRSREAMP